MASNKDSSTIVPDYKITLKSKLESIPAEMRNRIYGYIFSGESITCITTHVCRSCEVRDHHHEMYEQYIRHSISWLGALFRANKFLRGDVKPSFFQHVTFKLLHMYDDYNCFSGSDTGYPSAKGGIPSDALFSRLSDNRPMPDFFAKNLKHVAMPWFLLNIVSALVPNMPALETVTMHDFNLTLWHSWSSKETKESNSEEERKARQILQANSPGAVLGDSELKVKALLQKPNNSIKVFLLRTLVKCEGLEDRENAKVSFPS
jgi:hypothetical protein